jgi:hypothetical protein
MKKKSELLEQQSGNINSLQKSFKNQDKQLSEIDKLQRQGKRKNNLNSRISKCKRFWQQKKQDEMMKEFAKKMKQFG